MEEYEGVPHVVIPTIRDKEHMKKFFSAWKEEFKGCVVHVVFDMPKIPKWVHDDDMKEFNFPTMVYCWKDIDKDLGKDSWIIPRKTDCVRSYGYWKAWQYKPLFIVTLDDDVMPQSKHIETFYKKLFQETYPNHNFYNTIREGKLPRGTYLETTGCDVVHGGWLNVPDLSAEEQIKNPYYSKKEHFNEGIIPKGAYFSLCGMNIAWKPEVTKEMYFGLQGPDYPIDRCGDIWCGYHLAEKGVMVYTGEPYCYHTRASNVWSNLKKEKNAEVLSKSLYMGFEPDLYENYLDDLDVARMFWEGLFENE